MGLGSPKPKRSKEWDSSPKRNRKRQNRSKRPDDKNNNDKRLKKVIAIIIGAVISLGILTYVVAFVLPGSNSDGTNQPSEQTIDGEQSVLQSEADELGVSVEHILGLEYADELVLSNPYSENSLYKELINSGYSQDVSKYAVEHVDADWNEMAMEFSELYIVSVAPEFYIEELFEALEDEGFTKDEIDYVKDHIKDVEIKTE